VIVTILVMCGLSLVMSVAAIAINIDTMRMNRQINRWLDEEERKMKTR
jgi:cell division protein FtsL